MAWQKKGETMKKMVGLVVAVVLSLFGFMNPTLSAEEEKGMEFSTSVGYFSQYVGPFGATFYDKGVVQADVSLAHSSGLHLTVWGSISADGGWNSDFGDEVDLIVGFTKVLGPIEVDLGGAYYDVLKVGSFDGEDIYAATLNVCAPEVFLGLTPFAVVEVDFPYDKGGLQYQAGLKRSIGGIFEVGVLANGHNGAFGVEPELISSVRTSLTATITLGKLEVSPEVHYQWGFGGTEGMTEEKLFWWGVNACLNF